MSSLAKPCSTALPAKGISLGSDRGACQSRLTLTTLLVLVELHSLKGCGTADEFVGEFALMLFVTIDLLVGVTAVI
jgi:hypothetical protein